MGDFQTPVMLVFRGVISKNIGAFFQVDHFGSSPDLRRMKGILKWLEKGQKLNHVLAQERDFSEASDVLVSLGYSSRN